MSIIEPVQQRQDGSNGSDNIHVRHAKGNQTGTRAKVCTSDTTGAEFGARAIEDLVRAVLRRCSYHSVRQVSCEVRWRVLILRGRVPSFF